MGVGANTNESSTGFYMEGCFLVIIQPCHQLSINKNSEEAVTGLYRTFTHHSQSRVLAVVLGLLRQQAIGWSRYSLPNRWWCSAATECQNDRDS